MRRPALADILMVSVVLIWGMNFSIMKHAYTYFNPLAFTAMRFVIGVVTLAVVLKARGIPLAADRADLLPLAGLGFLSQSLYQILFVLGLAATKAGNAGLLTSLSPVFAYIAGILLKREVFSRRILAGMLLSFSGVVAVVLFGSNDLEFGAALRGDVLILVSALCWGWYTGGATRLAVKYGALRMTFWLMFFGALGLVPALLPFVARQDWFGVPLQGWLEFCYSTFLSIVYGYIVWSFALEHLGVSGTAVYSNVTPMVALIGAWLMLGERPGIAQIAGVVLILTGVFMVRSRKLVLKFAAAERQTLS
jgi:drug/metabolite transporter (DMT)-like permease